MIKLRGLAFSTTEKRVKKTIIDNLSLSIKPGALVAITGPNGGGKSTLAQLIMGIKTPTSGQILFQNKDITKLNITERAKAGISFSFQQPVELKGLTVAELLNIASGETLSKTATGLLLKKVGLDPESYLDREITHALSGGELKRLEIASVLARNGKLMIFDEPEAGIDLWSFEKLVKIFKNLQAAKHPPTIIVISHQEKLLKIADKIIVLESGKIKNQGIPEKILPKLTSFDLDKTGVGR